MATYICDQVVKKIDNAGSITRPIDQNSSNITEVTIFARPFVMSATLEFALLVNVYEQLIAISHKSSGQMCTLGHKSLLINTEI